MNRRLLAAAALGTLALALLAACEEDAPCDVNDESYCEGTTLHYCSHWPSSNQGRWESSPCADECVEADAGECSD
jgi:hypothetical protein